MSKFIALAGGVGGAKLALGLTEILSPDQLSIVVNTADDQEFYGLHVSPDLDTMMYTLSGKSNEKLGWGIKDESFRTLSELKKLGLDSWFQLGDLDFATHIYRTNLMKQNMTLSEISEKLCKAHGLEFPIIPMTDDKVRTVLTTDRGDLNFQEYFVKYFCEPKVTSIRFEGIQNATPSPNFLTALEEADYLLYCPSNPFLSLHPIIFLPGVLDLLKSFDGKRIAVSSIVNGDAIKGPTAKLLEELNQEISAFGIAKHFTEICDYFVLDDIDSHLIPKINRLGMKTFQTNIIMNSLVEKTNLAKFLLNLCN